MESEAASLEKQYVHDVYEQTAPYLSHIESKAWPRVREFLLQQKPGSLVADIGCGTGKYLNVNQDVYMVGCDLCGPLVAKAGKHGQEVLVCDNLHLPFRDGAFNAVISIGVIHHFCTAERRVRAVKEMARATAPGGEMMIYVWAQEQKRRQFPTQDVLVPWNKALCSRSSSESGDEGSSRIVSHEECTVAADSRRGKARGRRTCSSGTYSAVGKCCFKIPPHRDGAPYLCFGRSLHSWFFSKSLDESSMKRYIERVTPRGGLASWAGGAVLVQPARHGSVDLGLGGALHREPSLEDDEVFAAAESDEQGPTVTTVRKQMDDSAQDGIHGDSEMTEHCQLSARVKSTNDMNSIKARAVPLSSTDSILETVSMDEQEANLADSKDLMRYYHVFREGELTKLIEDRVPELSVQSVSFDHGNWCVIAKKSTCSEPFKI